MPIRPYQAPRRQPNINDMMYPKGSKQPGNVWIGGFIMNVPEPSSGVAVTPTPTPSITPTNTPTNTSTPTNTPTQTNTSTQTPTNTPTNTVTPTNTTTPTNTPTTTNTPTKTVTPTVTKTPTNTPSPTYPACYYYACENASNSGTIGFNYVSCVDGSTITEEIPPPGPTIVNRCSRVVPYRIYGVNSFTATLLGLCPS